MDAFDDDQPKKTPRATIVRRAIVFALAFACAGGWLYTRYIVKKETLGGVCSYDMHCRAEAPRCLKQSTDGDGVCSRPCDTDGDCAPDITCVKVELDEYDERGTPLRGGYCFPQALLDARRKKKSGSDAGVAKSDSWLDVPEVSGQLEGEIVLERGGTKASFEVKGTLVRALLPSKHARAVVDTSTLRSYSIDDDKKTFSASQLAAAPGDVKVTKTERKDVVAERPCDVWELDDGRTVREACVVKGGAFVDPTSRSVAPWEKELAVRGVLPLRVLEAGKPKLLATRVDVRPMDAPLFAIPKAYKNLAIR